MMKKATLLIFSILLLPSFLYATEGQMGDEMARRVGMGVKDVLTSPLDFVNSIEDARMEDPGLASLLYGAVRGVGLSIGRFAYGFYEIISFAAVWENDKSYPVSYESSVIQL